MDQWFIQRYFIKTLTGAHLGCASDIYQQEEHVSNIPRGVLMYILLNQSTNLLEKLHGRLVLLILPHILLHTD